MAYRVQPTEPRKQFPLVLRDLNGTELGLILCDRKGNLLDTAIGQAASPSSVMRISQGAPGYSDFELPYTPILQDSWTGGRGAKNFETGTTRYAESEGVDTSNGDIVLGPAPKTLTNNVAWISNYGVGTANSEYLWQLSNNLDYHVSRFTIASAMTIRSVKVRMRALYQDVFRVVIFNDVTSLPGTLLARSKPIPITSFTPDGVTMGDMVEYTVPISLAVTAGQVIYIGIENPTNELMLDTRTGTGIGSLYRHSSTYGWTSVADRVLKVQYSSDGPGKIYFLEYRGLTYAAKNYDDGTGVRLFRNGFHGFALTGSTTEIINTPWNLAGYSLTGKKLRILEGKGSRQETTWRNIMSNTQTGTNDTITLNYDDAFEVAPDTTSEIVVQGTDWMLEVTGHGLTKVVAQPLVVNNFVYFPQGPDVNIRKMRMNAGALEFADDVPNKADFIIACPKTTGGYQIWTAGVNGNVYHADAVTDWATALTMVWSNNQKSVSVSGAKITGLIPYGEPTMPFVMKEDGFGSINNDVYSDMPINHMITQMRSLMNGRAVAVSDVYLFFSMVGGRLERYYDRHLDDVGVDRDEGLPTNQQGEVADILTLPGRLLIAVNAGELGYSSVFQNNGQGWHEYYRAPQGKRIRKLAYQNIEGGVSRVLVSQESDVVALHYSINPTRTSGYTYKTTGTLQSARIYGSMRDVRKFFKRLTLFSEGLLGVSGYTNVKVQYRTDEDPLTWKDAVKLLEVSLIDETELSINQNVSGRWFEYRLVLSGKPVSNTVTPVVDAVLLDTITRTPPKDAWTLYFLMGDQLRDQQDDLITLDALDYQTQLNTWADSRLTPWPLRMYSMIPAFNDKLVMIEPPSISPIEVTVIGDSGEKTVVHKMLGQMRVMAV